MTAPPRGEPPLIVTARLDADTFARMDALRRRHFPAGLNRVPAHISLFHSLPGEEVDAVVGVVGRRCRTRAPVDLAPAPLRFLGRGVAFAYAPGELDRLRSELAAEWRPWLTAQDRQGFRAHLTIQNKVDGATAQALYRALLDEPSPPCRVDGVTVWRYLGGPWEHVATTPFSAAA